LAPGRSLGTAVALPELDWHAQGVPHYAWLLEATDAATVLAGGHAIPVRLPDAGRFFWHKLYSSAARSSVPAKAAKDLLQAATLAAVIAEQGETTLGRSLRDAPAALVSAARRRLPALLRLLGAHPQAAEQASEALR
ncbi:MAG: nucleotidyltransferase domain-containing protein, partial [Pseudomonadota bacterium]|nr:nucleotidyltransferase domain-containing protein [Pseudomonadota bacterium]